MIKEFKQQKIQQLLFGIILFVLYSIIMKDFTSSLIIVAVLTLMIGIGFNTSLLYDVEIEEDIIIIKTYSLLGREGIIKIKKNNLADLEYNDSFFSSYNLVVIFRDQGKLIRKKLYLNAEPWDKLMLKLYELKKLTQSS